MALRSPIRSSSISQNPSLRANISSLLAHLHNLTTSSSKNEVLYSLEKPLEQSSLAKFVKEICRSVAKKKRYYEVILLYKLLDSTGLSPDLMSLNILINSLCLCVEQKIMESMELMTKMGAVGYRPTVVTCNTLIDGLCKTGKISVAIKLLKEMAKGNEEFGVFCRPDVVTYSTIIDGLCKAGLIEKARGLYLEMKGLGISPDVYTYNILVNGYCLVERIGCARELFDSLTRKGYRPNVICYNPLIHWYCKSKEVKKALYLYRKMIFEGIGPDVIMYNTLLIGLFLKAKSVWSNIVGVQKIVYCARALLVSYKKIIIVALQWSVVASRIRIKQSPITYNDRGYGSGPEVLGQAVLFAERDYDLGAGNDMLTSLKRFYNGLIRVQGANYSKVDAPSDSVVRKQVSTNEHGKRSECSSTVN
ncbi:pentatricopeptide repeat-containing protein At5g39710-like [Pistacia vera]|uniref:pentatricopeptide repeat-containing protein At5g39710-like n=1 Tax=Pistacia vera TaxID=55513 RepID=UPI001263E469|nr:pentatricopeptide repeat-containing protein At5g39710-like [Pistacia vera]